MKKLVLALVVMALLASLGAAQYRDPVFLCGGYGTTSTYYATGLWVIDAANQTMTSLFPSWAKPYSIYSAQMDADNKNVVFLGYATTSSTYNIKDGLFRLDTTTKAITTLVQGNSGQNGPMYGNYRMIVNQDGDYLFSAYGRSQVTVPTTTTRYDYHILKYDPANQLTTFFTTYQFANFVYPRGYFSSCIGTDIDTGDILVNQGTGTSSSLSAEGYYPWFKVDVNGSMKFTTFSAGTYGTYYGRTVSYGKVQQEYRTGEIHDGYYQQVYMTKPGIGQGGYTTLYNWGYPGGFYWRYTSLHDLQSAPTMRYANMAYWYKSITSPTTTTVYSPGVGFKYNAPGFPGAYVDADPNLTSTRRYAATVNGYAGDWWMGRNISSVKTGANKWQIRYSCPKHAGKNYFAVLGASGIRPGIPLASGRTIWINFDQIVFLSLNNILLPFWSPGPQVLDSNGEAQGFLNTSLIAPLNGFTVHIAMIVMDATAPDGIAYIPDTYVMKLP